MGEEGIGTFNTRNSRKIYIPVYAMIFVLAITLAAIVASGNEIDQNVLILVFIFSAGLLIFTELHRLRTFYEITDHSVAITTGFLTKTTRRSDLLAISDADIIQNPWKILFNYGDVNVRLFSKDSNMSIKNINKPSEFVDFLEKKMDEKRK